MKVKSIYCKNFKRFTELHVTDLPATAKLVCLVGPNGAGKTSLFDVFAYCVRPSKFGQGNIWFDPDYHLKGKETDSDTWHRDENVVVSFHDNAPYARSTPVLKKEMFYMRSGYRHEADVKVEHFHKLEDVLLDQKRPETMAMPDKRVAENYVRIVSDAVKTIFSSDMPEDTTKAAIRDRLIGRVAQSVSQLFPDLTFEGVGDPMREGTFFFQKGTAQHWKYMNLSAGEKAAFDLILDFVVKREVFNDTVFCIDEPELHMHSQLQANLLQELFTLTPERCQLWIATHSVGMMRKAKEISETSPGSVVFLNFSDRDFDTKVEMRPEVVDRLFWKDVFSVAIGDLANLIAPAKVIFCEGSQSKITGARTGEFDAKCFRKIFEVEFPDTEFVSLGSATEVEKNAVLLTTIFQAVFPNVMFSRVIDRDDLAPEDVAAIKAKGTKVLSRRHIESYLYDDEILTKLCISENQPEKTEEVLNAKKAALAASVMRDNQTDDYKSMSPALYVALKPILNLTQRGRDATSFALNTLAPLVTAETATYKRLKQDLFEK